MSGPLPQPDDAKTPPPAGGGGGGEGVLRSRVVRPPGGGGDAGGARAEGVWRRPIEPDTVSARLTVLVHELSGLLDGSMRHMAMLVRESEHGGDGAPVSGRLRTVQAAMEKMADAIRHAAGGPPTAWLQHACGLSLADAARYAAGIMEPVAQDRGIAVRTESGVELEGLPPGHMYSVLVNALRNAIEACVAAGHQSGGHEIVLVARAEQRGFVQWAVLEVWDTGVGPPPSASVSEARRVFEPGFTTKAGGVGVGLALSRQIVEQLGGFITLSGREDGPKRGAVLRVAYPALAPNAPVDPIG